MEMQSAVMEMSIEENPPNTAPCNWKTLIKRKIPITTWLPQYNPKWLLHDFLAGFTVALTEIPQSIAYAGIAGLPLQYGLYSCFMGGFIYAIFGSCRTINMGSTSIMALLIQNCVNKMGVDASIFMSLIGGAVIFLFGVMNLGLVFEFFSYPVMAGFTSAAALTIASSQIKNFFGMMGQATGFVDSWCDFFREMGTLGVWDTTLGSVSLLLLFFLKEMGTLSQHLPKQYTLIKKLIVFLSVAKNAITLAIGTSLAYILETKNLHPFQLTGHVNGTFPQFKFPAVDNLTNMAAEYGISLLLVPLVAILETIAVAKVFSQGQSLDGNQEMLALGIANIAGSFVQSMPVTGSFTRTAVNNASGAKSNMASVFTGAAILATLPFLTSTFYYIPKTTLAAVIVCAMFYLFDFGAFKLFWKNKKLEFVPFLLTLVGALLLSLEYGILLGTGAHLSFILYGAARPKLELRKLRLLDCEEVYVVTPTGDIQFPAADFFRNVVLEAPKSGSVVFDGGRIASMDISVAKSIAVLVSEMGLRKQRIVLLNFDRRVQRVCLGVDRHLKKWFKSGRLEDVLQGDRNRLVVSGLWQLAHL